MPRATVLRAAAALFALLGSVPVHAQISFQEQYAKIVNGGESISAVDVGVFGENVSLATGATEFSATDVSLPGNDALPVAFGRRRNLDVAGVHPRFLLGDWDIDIPYIEGLYGEGQGWVNTSAKPAKRCGGPLSAAQMAPPSLSVGSYGVITPRQFWQGIHLHAKAGDRQEILWRSSAVSTPSDGRAYPYVSSGFWQFACTTSLASGHPGDGFIGRAPNGFVYTFDWMVVGPAPSVLWPHARGNFEARRERVRLYPTRIEDRHGNWVDYRWSGNRLTAIESGDGRRLDIGYDTTPGVTRIKTVSDNSTPIRTWHYAYTGASLTSVTLPDGSSWGLDFTEIGIGAVSYDTNTTNLGYDIALPCNWMRKLRDNEHEVRIDHPSGARGRFTFDVRRNGRANVESMCFDNGTDQRTHFPETPARYDTWSLARKRIEGPGLPGSQNHPETTPYQWTYAYESPVGNFTTSPCSGGCPTTRKTTIQAPDGAVTEHVFGIEFAGNDGKLLSTRIVDAGQEMRRETYEYVQQGDVVPFPAVLGVSAQMYLNDSHVGERVQPQKKREIVQAGITYKAETTAFDAWAYPTHVSRSSRYGSKNEVTAYEHNTGKWVLGQKLSLEVDGLVASRTDYDPVTALPMRAYAFGRLVNSAEYYVARGENGALKSITDGNGKTTEFLDYHRGVARLVKLPTGYQQGAEVNNYGAITSITDELGNTRWFDYRADGRLQRIRYPTGDAVAWNPREFEFGPAGAEYGLPAGHWKQTITHGAARKTTVFDALWRPVLVQEEDTVRGDVHLTVQRYDDAGRKTFASYPRDALCATCSLYSVAAGTTSDYDALGRLTDTSQSSELGPLGTTIRYAATEFSKTVTNSRGNSTTTYYRAYDEPVETWPTQIVMPESVVIDIDRDSLGKPRSITRRGTRQSDGSLLAVSATRSYVYDPYQQLCKTIEPEVGATVIGYDGAGNISWTATGLNLPNAYQCNHDSASIAAVRSDRTYDALNRPLDTTFADGSPSIHRTYWPDGQPKTVRTTSAVAGDSNVWSYEYNARRLLESETLVVDGTTYALSHRYSANGHPKTIVYPDLVEVDYAPDALGRPRQAANALKSYASNVTYGPHGGMSGFTYGNGIVRTLEVNVRGLPKRSHDVGVIDDTYGFDENANVASIADAIAGASRTLEYDDLDRLESVAVTRRAPWQAASYVYDGIDNIRTSRVGSRAYTHAYDGSNRLQSLDVAGVPELVYAYERGNLSRRGQQTFLFDQANRMVSKGGESASTNERYAYDGHGRRVKIVRTATGATRHTLYSLDGQLRFEVDLSRDAMTDYITLGGSLLAREESSAQQAPAAPVVTAPADNATGRYTVTWTAVDGAASYVLEERQGSGGWSDLYSGPGRSLSLTRGNGTYQYRARSCNASDCGAPGAIVTTIVAGVAPPAAPSNLVAAPSPNYTGNFELRWPASALADRYQVFERPNGAAWSATPIHEGPDTALRVNARPPGAYAYRVVACGTGCSAPGIERTVTVQAPHMPVPAAPVLTVPAVNSNGTYVASWTAVAGATKYVLQELKPDDWSWGNIYQGAQRTWTLVRPSGTYRYQVRACNTTGECGDYGPVSTVVVSISGQLAPPVPLGITPGTSLDGNATVTWGAVGGATRYELEWNPNAAGWSQRYSGSLLSRTELSLANGEYRYRARACDSQQCGDWTGESVLIVSQGSQAPPAVTSMTVSPNPSLDGTFTVSWVASPGATHYNLEERLRVGANGGEWTYPMASSQTPTSRTFVGRGNGHFDYRIRACKTGAMPSCSNYGATASVQVQRPGGIDAPTSITGPSGCMTVGGGQTVSFTIGWSAVAAATRYELEESDDRNGPTSVLAAAGTTLTLARDTRRNREINYLYRARACNASSCSEWRGTATACLVMPGTPRSFINQVRFLHTDALGSPVAETDEGGAVVKRTYYESYGAPVGGLYADGPGFTGHVTDSASGLSYMQQRYYDPLAGRFLSLDPVVTDANTGGGFNRYWYANNNPHKFTDPDGRNPLNPLDAYDFAKDVGGLIVAEICYVAAVINDDAAVADFALEDMRSKVFDATASTLGFIATGGKQVKAIAAAANSSSDVKKATGAYTVTHESGIKYHGKGGERRMEASARRNEQQYADPVVKKEHTAITDARQAFMEEARRIAADGGPGKGNYNKINSPGKKYLEEDG